MTEAQTLFDFRPAVRKTDPESSRIADKRMVRFGKKAKQCRRVFYLLSQNDGATSAELGAIMCDRYIPARRLPELEEHEAIVRGKIRMCNACGQPCVTWWVKNPLFLKGK